jgi:hypothetical protein
MREFVLASVCEPEVRCKRSLINSFEHSDLNSVQGWSLYSLLHQKHVREGYLNMSKQHYLPKSISSISLAASILIYNPQASSRVQQDSHKCRLLASQQILCRAPSPLRRIATATSARHAAFWVAVAVAVLAAFSASDRVWAAIAPMF